jgi:hypothetical protein
MLRIALEDAQRTARRLFAQRTQEILITPVWQRGGLTEPQALL